MMSPLVSVIIPVYNVEEYLDKCLNTVIHQNYKNLEIILVDDGSTDNSGDKVDEWAKRDNRIVPLHQNNQGLSAARNMGLDNSHGSWIVFIDSDDYVSENYISTMLQTAQKDNSDLVICQYNKVSNVEVVSSPLSKPGRYTQKEFWQLFYGPNSGSALVVAWDKLYSSRIFKDLRYKVGILNEDEQILYSVVKRVKSISIIAEALYFYLVERNDSIMANLKKIDHIREKFYDILLDRSQMLVNDGFKQPAVQSVQSLLMQLTGELAINPSKENWQVFWRVFNRVKSVLVGSSIADFDNKKLRVYITFPRLICWLKILRVYIKL
ncbi:glycosyltransferase family 2 protein [Lactobacillus delbrueckii]|uniref:glycosyltransferase family 2 protein n=1 Tax=Lactobacillus delbrueckii TaxID=1584 RepID=UPI0039C1FF3D